MQITTHTDPAPPRFRPTFDSLLAEQTRRRRETGMPDLDLIDSEQTRIERQAVLNARATQAIKIFTAQQRELSAIHDAAFEEGAAYARKISSADTLFWIVTGAMLGGSLTWWLLRIGGLVAAGA